MEPIRCIIVDDEPHASANLAGLLGAFPQVKVLEMIADPFMAAAAMREHKPALVFLDINMPGKSGFEVTRELDGLGIRPVIIFVTAFDEYAIDAIRHAAFDFLVKPVDPADLKRALGRYSARLPEADRGGQFRALIERTVAKPRLKISSAGGFSLIDPADIVYIHADWNYSELFFGEGKSELATLNIGTLEEMLPPGQFYRISRSLIVNVNYLKKVSRKKREALLVKDGTEYRFPIPLLNIRKLESFLENPGGVGG